MNPLTKKLRDYAATLFGAAVAIANAWYNIDWDNFEFNQKNIFKLSLSALIAIGGYVSVIKTKDVLPANADENK